MESVKLAILASGNGSNAEAIMSWAQGLDWVEVVCLLSDKENALVLTRALKYGIPTIVVEKKKNETREKFDERILTALVAYSPDWIILAGYMKILTVNFLKHYENRTINIHPSLLPLFPGADGYGDAHRAGVKESGCTIHYVNEKVDCGEIIAQKKFAIEKDETLESLKKRGLTFENEFYPEVLEKLLQGLL